MTRYFMTFAKVSLIIFSVKFCLNLISYLFKNFLGKRIEKISIFFGEVSIFCFDSYIIQ